MDFGIINDTASMDANVFLFQLDRYGQKDILQTLISDHQQ